MSVRKVWSAEWWVSVRKVWSAGWWVSVRKVWSAEWWVSVRKVWSAEWWVSVRKVWLAEWWVRAGWMLLPCLKQRWKVRVNVFLVMLSDECLLLSGVFKWKNLRVSRIWGSHLERCNYFNFTFSVKTELGK